MTCIRFAEFLLFLLILRHVWSGELYPLFRAKGTTVELGFCFGADYIVVYRAAKDGYQLLGNSSDSNVAGAPPEDVQGRTRITVDPKLISLQINNLTQKDSGIYRRECWENQTQLNQHTNQLSVCDEEIESEEFAVKEDGGGAELRCNNTLIGQEGVSVRWYHELYPNYKLTVFLDTSVSMKPLPEEQLGVVEVRDKGALLLLNGSSVLKSNHHFYCLVIKGADCLSFQNIYPPDNSETREIFASQGERVVLYCPTDGENQQWDTPMGEITANGTSNQQIQISSESKDFSLVLSDISDEHIGEYSCLSSTLEMVYTLSICPTKVSQQVLIEGETISLKCNWEQMASQRVQWYRRDPSGKDELLHDTSDETIATPEDLRGRMSLSEDGSSLNISDVKISDKQEYICIVLKGTGNLSGEGEDTEQYDGEDTDDDDDDDEYSDGDYWPHTLKCFSKQVTALTERVEGDSRTLDSDATAAPSEPSNMVGIAVAGGLVGLLVVVAIIVGIVVKKKAKSSPRQRQAASERHAEALATRDPGCTEQLTNGDDLA